MDPLDNLTPDEKAALTALLRRINAESAPVEVGDRPPAISRCYGRIGRFGVYVFGVALGVAGFVKVLLIPADVERAYVYYSPRAQWAYQQLVDVAYAFDSGKTDPSSIPPSTDYYVFDETLPPGTTTTTPPPDEINSVTVVASTGVNPGNMKGSGLADPPSTWI